MEELEHDGYRVEKKDLSKLTGSKFLLQVMKGCADNSRCASPCLVASQREVFALLQQTQEFYLRRIAEVADFIEEQCPAGRFFELSGAAASGAGVSTIDVAEQRISKYIIIKPRNIHAGHGTLVPAKIVDCPCDQFLSCATFAG